MTPLNLDTLSGKKKIITAEISPPKGCDLSRVLSEAELLSGCVDAINVTDNQKAVMRMSPVAVCSILQRHGFETIMHMTCRDRNRLALQSDLLAAYALGVRNILVMSGDHTSLGDNPGAKPVFDLDSVQLLTLINRLKNGIDACGNPLQGTPDFCAGAVSGISTAEMNILKFEKKVKAGAEFIQTQAVFDTGRFEEFIDATKHLGINILAGIIPLKSEKSAGFLKRIPGIYVPDDVASRMKNASDPLEEGCRIAAELVLQLKEMCRGIHIMTIGGHTQTRRVLELAGAV